MSAFNSELTELQWKRANGEAPFLFRHQLGDHPLLTLASLADLADRLPAGSVETTTAHSELAVPERVTERVGAVPPPSQDLTPGDLVRSTQEDSRWFSFRNVERDPAYAVLVESVFAEFLAATASADRPEDRRDPEGYVFLGASGAVTPTHVDHEHNLFFQISGSKMFTIGGFESEQQRSLAYENMYADGYGSTVFLPSEAETFDLESGDGLYVPPTALHYVKNSESLAIAFSLVFHDDALDRSARVFAANSHLRQLGLKPRPPGESAASDRAKSLAVSAWRTVGGRIKRS